MVIKEITVKNRSGLQSKAAAVFIQKASAYKSDIWVEKGERKTNAKSLLGVLSLGICSGEKIAVTIEGEDEAEAAGELEKYLISDTVDV